MVGFGTALAGVGAAQPQLQQLQEMQQKRAQEAAIGNALKQYAAQQKGGQMGPPAPGQPAPGAPGAAGKVPDLNTMVDLLSKSQLPPDQQYEALKNFGAFSSPFDKMMNQLDMKQMQLSNTSTMLSERLQAMRDIANLKESGLNTRTDKRADNAEATRDVGGIEKELADQRAYLTGLLNSNPKSIDTPEYKAEKQKYDSLQKELQAARAGGKGKTAPAANPAAPSAAAPEGAVPVPPEGKDQPDGTTATDEKGQVWVKQGDYMVPQKK